MTEHLNGIKNLPPEERIKRLKEIEKKDEEEISKTRKMIKESEAELEENLLLQRKIPMPQMKSIDISTLFGKKTEEEGIFLTHGFKISDERQKAGELDNILSQSPSSEEPLINPELISESERGYAVKTLSYMPVEITKKRVDKIKEIFQYDSGLNQSEKKELINELAMIGDGTKQKMSDWYEGAYIPTQGASEAMKDIYNVIKEFFDKYR